MSGLQYETFMSRQLELAKDDEALRAELAFAAGLLLGDSKPSAAAGVVVALMRLFPDSEMGAYAAPQPGE